MFCFHCSDQLTERSGELYCARGDMYVSINLRNSLQSAVKTLGSPIDAPRVRPSQFKCVRCGKSMFDTDKHGLNLSCLDCGLKLGPAIVNQMIELHRHKRA